MATFREGKQTPGGGAPVARDAATVGGGDVYVLKPVFGPDGTIKYIEDAAGGRIPMLMLVRDGAGNEVSPGDNTNTAIRVNIVAGASVSNQAVDDAPATPGTELGIPCFFVYSHATPDQVDDGDKGFARMTKDRFHYNAGFPRALKVKGQQNLSGTGESTLIAAGAAGIFHDLTWIGLYNGSTTDLKISVRDISAGSIELVIPLKGGQGMNTMIDWPQDVAANAWTVQANVAPTGGTGEVNCHACAVKRPTDG